MSEQDKRQKQNYYKFGRGGGPEGGPGRGGGRGRGRGKPGGAGGASFVNEERRVVNPLGSYREGIAIGGMTSPGISVTTIQFKERSAERELIEYLETIADEMDDSTMTAPADDDDVEASLKQELEGMTYNKSTRFRLCLHDTPCVIYINVLPPLDPVQLVYRIMEKVESTGQSPFKYVKRLVPIQATSSATMHQVGELAKPLAATGFATPDNRSLKFAIQPNSRNSNKLERLETIKRIADEVIALQEGHTVDLSNADRTILVEVDKNCLGMSVVQHYDRYKRFNPSMIAETIAKARAGEGSSAEQTANQSHNERRPARTTTLNAAAGIEVGIGGGEKRKAEEVGYVDMGEEGGEAKASKIQRME